MGETAKTATGRARTDTAAEGFTEEERAAMKERAQELKSSRRSKGKADDEASLLAKVAELPEPDRGLAERVHAIVKESAPSLAAKTRYGMPAYARDGKVVFFFQPAAKFSTRYATLGFNDVAPLDDGEMWPTAFAITELTAEVEARITDLVRRSAG